MRKKKENEKKKRRKRKENEVWSKKVSRLESRARVNMSQRDNATARGNG